VIAAVDAGNTSELRTFDGDHFDPITVGHPASAMCAGATTSLLT
jgi:hypothetical protein